MTSSGWDGVRYQGLQEDHPEEQSRREDGHERGVRPRSSDEAQTRGEVLQQLGGEWSGESELE